MRVVHGAPRGVFSLCVVVLALHGGGPARVLLGLLDLEILPGLTCVLRFATGEAARSLAELNVLVGLLLHAAENVAHQVARGMPGRFRPQQLRTIRRARRHRQPS
ncbi:hypothetical protein T484DRAFT_1976056 [Baffinella frigidus]|nr:hypothetical protein T484DRAFT_1976056 [Cryptophyta sp. CCMP2293]